MKTFLVIGLGRFGRHIVRTLSEEGHQVMAIDEQEERVDEILSVATNAQIGNATNEDFLRSLGIRNFDVCVVAIGDDFLSSLEVTSLLKELGAKFVVARASRDVQRKFLLRNGADACVYPERQVAQWTAMRYSSDCIFDYIKLSNDYSIYELAIPDNWVGKSIMEIDVRRKYHLNILAIKDQGRMEMNMSPEIKMQSGQTVLVLGHNKDIKKCFHI